MEIITLDDTNLDSEHICCAISDKKGECQVASKKAWLREMFKDGLVFKKGNVRGKVFIEYIPAENAWCPIIAENYMFINCLWVSGKYKGQRISNQLLNECIVDSKQKGKSGLVVLSSNKKKPYLSDPKYLRHKGFILADTKEPYYELLYLPFNEDAKVPKFKGISKRNIITEPGFVLYYSNQCPFTSKYVSVIDDYAKENDIKLTIFKYKNKEDAQNSLTPFSTYSLFYNGEFITHEILNEKKFKSILKDKGFDILK